MPGDIAFTIDRERLRFADTVTHRGVMFTGVPNMARPFGYLRASWTLRVDPENFDPGHLERAPHLLPKQGDREPWRHPHDYWTERDALPAADLDDRTPVVR